MPRRTKPLRPADGPLAVFALALRDLRDGAPAGQHFEVAEMALAQGVSRSAVYAALQGSRLPSRLILQAMVREWAADPKSVMNEWMRRRTECEAQLAQVNLSLGDRRRPPQVVRVGVPETKEGPLPIVAKQVRRVPPVLSVADSVRLERWDDPLRWADDQPREIGAGWFEHDLLTAGVPSRAYLETEVDRVIVGKAIGISTGFPVEERFRALGEVVRLKRQSEGFSSLGEFENATRVPAARLRRIEEGSLMPTIEFTRRLDSELGFRGRLVALRQALFDGGEHELLDTPLGYRVRHREGDGRPD